MKKFMIIVFAALMLLSVAACGGNVSDSMDPAASMGRVHFVPGVYGAYVVHDGEAYGWGEFGILSSAENYDTDYVSSFVRFAASVPDIKQIPMFSRN